MTIQRRLRDHHRLDLERARDALFEARVTLAELNRDQSIIGSLRVSLAKEVSRLERHQLPDCLEQARSLRDRIRTLYGH